MRLPNRRARRQHIHLLFNSRRHSLRHDDHDTATPPSPQTPSLDPAKGWPERRLLRGHPGHRISHRPPHANHRAGAQ